MDHSLTFSCRGLIAFLRFAAARFKADRCADTAAKLTFGTLLSVVPFATIALALAAAFPVFQQFTASVKAFLLTHMVPESASLLITVYMAQFSEKAAQLTALGIVLLTVTAFGLMYTINDAFNAIWRVRRPRAWLKRLLAYWAVLTLGPMLIGASLSLTTYVVGLAAGVATLADTVLLHLTPAALTILAFYLMYALIPNRRTPRSHSLAGALIAALLFEVMKRGFAAYIVLFPTYTFVYGAFAAVPIFLLWLYLSWLVVMLGAEIAASLTFWAPAASGSGEAPEARPEDAVRILRSLSQARRLGEGRSPGELRALVPLDLGCLERLLENLCAARIVARTSDGKYLLARDPGDIRLLEVWQSLAAPVSGSRRPPADASDALATRLARIEACVGACLQDSLSSLLEERGPAASDRRAIEDTGAPAGGPNPAHE